nr:hypothetical protein Iba_chr04dCG10850 [Ipomoea batatas]
MQNSIPSNNVVGRKLKYLSLSGLVQLILKKKFRSILAVQNLAQNAKAFGGTCSSSLTHSNTHLCSKSVAATLPAAKTSRSRSKFVAKSRLFQGSSTNSVFVALARSMEVVAHSTALHTRVFVVAFVRRRLLQGRDATFKISVSQQEIMSWEDSMM